MALSEAELVVVVRAVTAELQAGMAQATAAVQAASASIRTGLAGVEAQSALSQRAVQTHAAATAQGFLALRERVSVGLDGVRARLLAFGEAAGVAFAFLEGKKLFGDVIESSREFAFTVEDLARRLGISTQEASRLLVVAREYNVPIATLEGAYRALARTLNTNEAAFRNLGIQTRDAHGNFLPLEEIFIRTTERLKDYKAGTDQQVAATQVMKRAVGDLSTLLRVDWRSALEEARATTAQYGLELSTEQIEAQRKFEEEVNRAKLALVGFATQVAPVLEPFFGKLLGWVRDATLRFGEWAGLTGEGRLLNAFDALATAQAKADKAVQSWGRDSAVAQAELRNLAEAQQEMTSALAAFQAQEEGGGTKLPGTTGTEHAPPSPQLGAKAETEAFERLKAERDADLAAAEKDAEAKLRIEQRFALQVLTLRGVTNKQLLDAEKDLNAATRAAAEQRAAIQQIGLAQAGKEQVKELDEEKKGLEERLRLGTVSGEQFRVQAELLAFQKLQIEQNLVNAERALHEGDPKEQARLDAQLLDLRAAYGREVVEIDRRAAQASVEEWRESSKVIGQLVSGLGGAFNTALESAVDGNRTQAEVLRSIWQGLLKDALRIAEEIVATWAKTAVVRAAGVTPSTKAGELSAQFAGVVGSFLGFGGPGGGGGKEVADAQATEGRVTAVKQAGLARRFALEAADYARRLALAIGHYVQLAALEVAHLAKFIATSLAKVAIIATTEAEILAIKTASAIAGKAVVVASALKEIIAYAYSAASGAASAVASIPYAGPILAVVNYGIVLAKVLAGVSSVSAQGGADLPSGGPFPGVLHSRELVLPAPIAETVRQRMAFDRGGGEGVGTEVHHHHYAVTIHTIDAQSLRDLFRRYPGILADAAARGGAQRPARGRHP